MAQVQIPLVGSLGLIIDPYEQDVPPNAWSTVRNVRFADRGAEAMSGDTEIMAGATIDPLWLKYFPDRTYPRWAYADNNKVFVFENFTHTEITRFTTVPGDNNYNAVDRWQGAVHNGIGILNNGFDAPQQWGPIDDGTVLTDLDNWPADYRCRFIKPFKNFLIAGHIYNGSEVLPFRCLWSHPADPGSVPPSWDVSDPAADAGQFDLVETSDHLIDGLQMGDLFIVYREGSFWAMQLTGDSNIFRNFRISGSAGAVWKDCVVSLPIGHVVAGWDDMVIHAGSADSVRSVLDRRNRKWISANRDSTYFKNSFLCINEPEKEVWYCFPEIGHQYASIAVVWNWVSNAVGTRELSEVPFADSGPIVLEA